MHYDLIIKNAALVTVKEIIKCDIAVSGGFVAKTGELECCDTADEIYDAAGKYVLPGIIDTHVHFRDPGLTEKEDFETGSLSAAMGGITMIADMPNVMPVTSTARRFNEKVDIIKEKSYIDFALFALLNNDNLSEMEELKKAGALGFKVFLAASTGDLTFPSPPILMKQMEKSASLGSRVCFHCETTEINQNFTEVAKKETDSPDGFWLDYARPVISEVYAIKAAINFAIHSKAKIHILHVTSADGISMIDEARQIEAPNTPDVTVETCPHYLLLTNSQGEVHKVYPPLRDETHCDGLWQALSEGIIDMIASDHAPHTIEEKSLPLWEAPAGLCGVETMLPLLLNEVNKGNLSLNDIVRLCSEAPAKIWGIYHRKGNLLPGADADITIVDMNVKKTIRYSDLHSKSKTSPYDGMEVQGAPVATIVRGNFVMKDGKLTGKKGYGTLISPAL
ncbi:MAG: dihydroorotase family protein [Treponema sp.]|jgi:dihydroorotase|nr:dihydroorotase family protein [Treponema sp.]